jgi:hypothetical protein
MSNQGDAGAEWALAANTLEGIEEQTGVKLGGVNEADGYLDILYMKEQTQKKLDKKNRLIKKIEGLMARVKLQLKSLKIERRKHELLLEELEKLERDYKIKEFMRFKKEVRHDISKLGLASGHSKRNLSSTEEVFG